MLALTEIQQRIAAMQQRLPGCWQLRGGIKFTNIPAATTYLYEPAGLNEL